MIRKIKSKVRDFIGSIVRRETQNALQDFAPIIPQVLDFQNSQPEERQSFHDHTKAPLENFTFYTNIRDRLRHNKVPVEDINIDIADFEEWLREFPKLKATYQNMGEVFIEKCLEHYLTFRFLNCSSQDIFIDIAAAGSPFADLLSEKGITSYRLDLSYPEGIHGRNIGADAGDMPLSDNFAHILALHCAYECFMGDTDIKFIHEASRILHRNGRYGIIPLYLDDIYFVATSPYCDQNKVVIEKEATKVWRDDSYVVPFSRHYSPEAFCHRIYSAIPSDMSGKVLFFKNLPEIIKHYGEQRIYCYFMFLCTKK